MNARNRLLLVCAAMVLLLGLGVMVVVLRIGMGKIDYHKYPLELDAVPLPSPPIEEALQAQHFVVIGTIWQSKPRLGWEPAIHVDVDEWITEVTADVMYELSGVKDGHRLLAYISMRGSGHPLPPDVVGSEYLVVVQRGPRFLQVGENERVENARCHLVGAYPATPELIERVRESLASKGEPVQESADAP